MSYLYKIAKTPEEFEQIHQLNYQTFVEEIPQHKDNENRTLQDRFHRENTYIICLYKKVLIGMICVRHHRPFSLDGKIGLIENHLPFVIKQPCEIRLLAVNHEHRNGRVFLGLAQALIRFCLQKGYDAAVISGTTRELKLYRQLGFQPFAYVTGTEEAAFQPMYLTKDTFDQEVAGRLMKEDIHFLPGPVPISPCIKEAFLAEPISHRSKKYQLLLSEVEEKLKKLTRAQHVQLVQGSGTLANEMVAGQLHLLNQHGLILVNGEFGNRLVDHASRWGLSYDVLQVEYGEGFTEELIKTQLRENEYRWLWAVHCETSTGVLNDLEMLKEICLEQGLKLCVDAISSIGAVDLSLQHVAFATGVSGKAIGSYPGLSFIFYDEAVHSNGNVPRYMDLGFYIESKGVPFTQSSNQLFALDEALKKYQSSAIFEQIEENYREIRDGLEEMGLEIVTEPNRSSPIIMTVRLPQGQSAEELGQLLHMNGFLLHYESEYLRTLNWIQIACINPVAKRDIRLFLRLMREYHSNLTSIGT